MLTFASVASKQYHVWIAQIISDDAGGASAVGAVSAPLLFLKNKAGNKFYAPRFLF